MSTRPACVGVTLIGGLTRPERKRGHMTRRYIRWTVVLDWAFGTAAVLILVALLLPLASCGGSCAAPYPLPFCHDTMPKK